MSGVRPAARDAREILAAHQQRAARGRRRRRWIVSWVLVGVVVALVCFAAGLLAAPINYDFQPVPPVGIQLLDERGHEFATIPPPEQQTPVPSREIPTVVKHAFVAAEDQRFYSENGIDPIAIVRAAWSDITGGTFSGASTITQQYVKDVYSGATSTRTPLRKLREAALAIRLDSHLTKDQILTRYLNEVYLGNGTAGVDAACRFYYGVPVSRIGYDPGTGRTSKVLALARAATLAGFVPAPSDWNPVKDPKQARARELYVIQQMIKIGYTDSRTGSRAYGTRLPRIVARTAKSTPTIAPQFRDLVSQQLRIYGDDQLYRSGGMQVTTTLNLRWQRAAVAALHQVLPSPSDPQAAIVAVDPRSGAIRALAARQNPPYRALGYDLADPPSPVRSSGSTIKPFTLAVALERGHSLGELHLAPSSVTVDGYTMHNAEPAGGTYSLESALAQSVNTIYGPLALQVGLQRVKRLAHRAGMRFGPMKGCGRHLCPSYALGMNVSPLSEANAFGVFVNGGIHHTVHSVLAVRTAAAGELAPPVVPGRDGNRVMPASVADRVKQAMAEVVTSGTGRAAAQPFPVYGKTGTTDNYENAWFTGCTPTLCITVYLGYEKRPRPMYHAGEPVFGGTLPAQIFAKTYADERLLAAGQPLVVHSPPATGPSPPTVPLTPGTTAPATPPAGSPTGTPTARASGRATTSPAATTRPARTPRTSAPSRRTGSARASPAATRSG